MGTATLSVTEMPFVAFFPELDIRGRTQRVDASEIMRSAASWRGERGLRSEGCVCLLSWQPAAARDPALGYTGDKQYYIPPPRARLQTHTHARTEGHCYHGNSRGRGGKKKRRNEEAPLAGKHLRRIRSLSFSLSLPDTFCLSRLHSVAMR